MISGHQLVIRKCNYHIARADRRNFVPAGEKRYITIISNHKFHNPVINEPRIARSYLIDTRYNGKYCELAGVQGMQIYHDLKDAVSDACRLADASGRRFWVYRNGVDLNGVIVGVATKRGFKKGGV